MDCSSTAIQKYSCGYYLEELEKGGFLIPISGAHHSFLDGSLSKAAGLGGLMCECEDSVLFLYFGPAGISSVNIAEFLAYLCGLGEANCLNLVHFME